MTPYDEGRDSVAVPLSGSQNGQSEEDARRAALLVARSLCPPPRDRAREGSLRRRPSDCSIAVVFVFSSPPHLVEDARELAARKVEDAHEPIGRRHGEALPVARRERERARRRARLGARGAEVRVRL